MPTLRISFAAIALLGGVAMFVGTSVSAAPLATGAGTLASQAEEQALAVPIEIRRGMGGAPANVSRSIVRAPRTLSGPVVRTSPTLSRSIHRAPRFVSRPFVRAPRYIRRGSATIIFGGIGPIWPYYDVYPDYYYPDYYDVPNYLGDAIAYCRARFRSYDVRSMTYLGYDGLRHRCP